MKKLIIVESPAKIKTIKKFLGADFTIMSTMGHIKDLPSKTMGVTRDPIAIEYVVMDNKQKTITDLCKAASSMDEVYLAPDPDREGEIIAWHIAEEIKKVLKKKATIHRISFNEITKSAIKEALDHPYTVDMQKVAAQQARRVLDRWVGYEVSPILWKRITKGLSAGRVQSVALKFICERELTIRSFITEEYWSIFGTFAHKAGSLVAALTHINNKKAELKNKEQVDKIIEEIKKGTFAITQITDKERLKNSLPPFMTSSLQQAAYNQLGFSVDRTMKIAQGLYEGIPLSDGSPTALITYMRTDSLRIADSALAQVREFIDDQFGKKYLPKTATVFEKKSKAAKAQDAHEAVRPVDVAITPESIKQYLTAEQAKLYELIWRRFIASQMTPALYAQRQIVIDDSKHTFKATGSTLLFDGFLKVYEIEEEDEKEENTKIPDGLKEKDSTPLKTLDPKQHFTQPPARYSEASLVKELEKEGIGRPSTYASIMNTIRARSYTTVEKKRFVPTELGMAVVNLLKDNLPNIMDTKFTAHMEEDLDKIAAGDLDRDKLLNDFYTKFETDLTAFKGETGKSAQPTELDCPECKTHKLAIRFGKAGEFLGCLGYPECGFTSNFARNSETNILELVEKEKPKELDMICPNCEKPLREMMGKFGKFISCSGFPECKYIHQNKANFKCPQDGGDITERKWRGGTFWGCSNYPKCKYALFGDIEETACPKCNAPALIKKPLPTGDTTLECGDKKCGYTSAK